MKNLQSLASKNLNNFVLFIRQYLKKMEVDSIGSAIGLLLSGGALSLLFRFLVSSRKSSLEELREVVNIWKEENKDLKNREDENREMISKLEAEMNALKNKIILLESAHQDLPIPQWLKDLKGTMLSVNPAFEEMFLKPIGLSAFDLIGKTDDFAFGEEYAKGYRAVDQLVIDESKHVFVNEKIKAGNNEQTWEVLKYPRFVGKTIVGVGGIAIKRINK